MSRVRVTYSGLISFIAGIISIITGLIFTLIITRELSQEEFGTWSLIGALIGYILVINPIANYWSTREIARGEDSGKTSLILNILFSMIGVLIYLIVVLNLKDVSSVNIEIFIFAGILIPIEFIRTALWSISSGYKPQLNDLTFMIIEISKIPTGIILIYFMDWGLMGAIIATTISSIMGNIVLYKIIKEKLRQKFNLVYLKKWFKLSWISLYPQINGFLSQFDILIFTLITGSVNGLAYWTSSFTVSRILRHASNISTAVYPKLLSGGKKEIFQENIIQVFYFSLPLSAISIVFAEPVLYALNPLYTIAYPVVIFMVPLIFTRNLSKIFFSALSGIENVDSVNNSSMKDYLKSKLILLPTLNNIQSGIYITTLIGLLLILKNNNESEINLVITWVVVALVIQIPFTLYLFFLIKKEISPKIDYMTIIKYLIATIISFSTIYMIMKENLVYAESIFEFLPNFMPYLISSMFIYFVITYFIEKRIKNLTNLTISEIKKKVKTK